MRWSRNQFCEKIGWAQLEPQKTWFSLPLLVIVDCKSQFVTSVLQGKGQVGFRDLNNFCRFDKAKYIIELHACTLLYFVKRKNSTNIFRCCNDSDYNFSTVPKSQQYRKAIVFVGYSGHNWNHKIKFSGTVFNSFLFFVLSFVTLGIFSDNIALH